jgi:hypothetical protein
MPESTHFQEAVIRQDSDTVSASARPAGNHIGQPFTLPNGFLMRRPFVEETWLFPRQNDGVQATPRDQTMRSPKVLVSLSSQKVLGQKVTLLQRWIGRVTQVNNHTFVAIVSDTTRSQRPDEEVELDRREIPRPDLYLLISGAAFYWSIGYEDSADGQRRRVSELRFVRQPHLTDSQIKRTFERADRLAAFLEH